MFSIWQYFTGSAYPDGTQKAALEALRAAMGQRDEGEETALLTEVHRCLAPALPSLSSLEDAHAVTCSPHGALPGPGPAWKLLGFQHEYPRSDIRGGGLLAVRSLHAFVTHATLRATARDMCRHRSVREPPCANYPWAALSFSCVGAVAKVFTASTTATTTTTTTTTTTIYCCE